MSARQKPFAWAVIGDGFEYATLLEEHARAVAEEESGTVVPLYRQPQPAFTDAERAAVGVAIRCVDAVCSWKAPQDALREKMIEHTSTLRGLLERQVFCKKT